MPQRTAQKKPVQVQVWTYDSSDYDDACDLVAWCGGKATDDGIVIHTLEGDHLVQPGDVIIRGVRGEFYPCKPGIFAETYDEVGA